MTNANTNGAIARISKEIANLQTGNDLSLAVAFRDSDVRSVRGLIIGPPETPYEYGFFEFSIKIGKEYPIKAPEVQCITTNRGTCRFNPNIYADGKVCLSILGTWRGQSGEEWSSAQGLESILLSIQSLMSSNPYENEPGFESCEKDADLPKAYVAKIRHETLRIAVIERLEKLLGIRPEKPKPKKPKAKSKHEAAYDKLFEAQQAASGEAYKYDAEATYNEDGDPAWDPFADLLKRRFLWYYDTYLRTIDTFAKEQDEGADFLSMEFEYPPNSMRGSFHYQNLRKRLENIREALEEEQQSWASDEGLSNVTASSQLAAQLQFQVAQLQEQWHAPSHPSKTRIELSIPDPGNLLVWQITLFGAPSTNLDGGVFNMHVYIPPNFPDAQPRVVFATPISHHRVSAHGVLCYFPSRPDDLASHLEAIVNSVEDENPTFDPRAVVNPAMFELYWGGEEKRKVYSRKLRRSAQDSSEF